MLKIEIITLTVGQLQTNCYIVYAKGGFDCLIIDPGDDGDYIKRIIADHKLIPVKIIASHGHFDHIMAVTELKLAYNIPFVIHEKDEFLVKKMKQSAKHFLGIETDPAPTIDGFIVNGQWIMNNDIKMKVMETPGHTPGSICLYQQKENILFTGDTIFADGGVGRTDFSYSSEKDLHKSLALLFKLPAPTVIYPGHGRMSTIGEEWRFREMS